MSIEESVPENPECRNEEYLEQERAKPLSQSSRGLPDEDRAMILRNAESQGISRLTAEEILRDLVGC